MGLGTYKNLLRAGVVVSLVVLVSAGVLCAADTATGNIVGFVYDRDGTTPLEGAMVQFKNLANDNVIASSRSNKYGIFKLERIESGIYVYGVVTAQGNFNSDGYVAVKINANETAKMAISLNPYDKEEAKAVSEMFKEQKIAGESLVGVITDFNPSTLFAKVEITKGVLRLNDKIHAKGSATDFYQEVNTLMAGNSTSRKVLPGQIASVKLEKRAAQGDLVYVVRNRNLLPLFLAPLGIASILAASSGDNYGIVKINEEIRPASAFKNR
jgi:hypothetical protein